VHLPLCSLRSGASVGRCGFVVVVIAVFNPLPYVPVYVVEAGGVRLLLAGWLSLFPRVL
jgi:hypothetical protein